MAEEHLATVCGLYCGACTIYRARLDNNQKRLEEFLKTLSSNYPQLSVTLNDLYCDGCLAQGRLVSYCQYCRIRQCANDKPGVTRCSDCSDFPCSFITDFNNDGLRHHAEALKNLRRQQETGVEAWLKEEEERWRCPQCQAPVEWYAQTCFHCGTPQPNRLPSSPGGA